MSNILEQISLTELRNVPVETVLAGIDRDLVHLPSYRDLYYRWERQQWSVHELDFLADRLQWENMTDEEQDEHLIGLFTFFQGEASVTDALAPYIIAMPDEEMRFFVTTQLVDETRHTIFFARFFSEGLGIEVERVEETLVYARQFMNAASKKLLVDSLADIAERLRCEPHNLALLVEGVVLYHVITEGTMALSGQKTLLESYRKENLFPGFRSGFTAVARDESRHVLFGMKFLRDMLQQENSFVLTVEKAIEQYAPIAFAALAPHASQIATNSEEAWSTARFARASLSKKLKVIGLTVELPSLPEIA
jgi:ribonucleoside-diphosphate reductase beta chain